jgi:serine/threonine protein kinase
MPAYKRGVVHNDRGTYSTLYKGGRVVYDCKPAAAGYMDLVLQLPLRECAIKEMKLQITPAEDAATPRTRSHTYSAEIDAILYEAIIHLLVCRALSSAGHPSFVPTFYEVVAVGTSPLDSPTRVHSLWSVMEFLKGQTVEDVCRRRLKPLSTAATAATAALQLSNAEFILDVVTQVAFILYILQRDLRFHHRDLKLNNVFCRDTPSTQRLALPTGSSWVCTNDLVLLDFGFSCIACGSENPPSPRATLLGAGSWFTPDDDCCKEGRDLAQFLYSLHCHFPLQDYVGPDLFAFFKRVLTATTASGPVELTHGIAPDGTPLPPSGRGKPAYHKGIYCFLKRKDVEVPLVAPAAFLSALHARTPPKVEPPGTHGP